jgi:hypothetical protein
MGTFIDETSPTPVEMSKADWGALQISQCIKLIFG